MRIEIRSWVGFLVLVPGLVAARFALGAAPGFDDEPARGGDAVEFRAMTWNIWHGGREDGEEIGPRKVVDVIRRSGADLVAVQETYGSGEKLAEALGFRLHARGTNVSILSRFPIVADVSVFEEFKCVGAVVELPNGARAAFYSIWLPYADDIWKPGERDPGDVPRWIAACQPSADDLVKIRDAIDRRLAESGFEGIPLIVAGDFNSMSHLDYTEVARDQFGAVVDWPTSRVMTDAGFRDAHRERNPIVDRARDRTWSPRFEDQEQDRIDFIYHRHRDPGARLEALESTVIDEHPEGFPSDHAATLVRFRHAPRREAAPRGAIPLRTVSYNIRHGRGNDDALRLDRTAAVLAELRPDFVALQEVDMRATRSGSTNQAAELGRMLGMHPAFGAFMEFQGGWYGLGILSRHPLRSARSIRLPDGNEPRVALIVEAILPDDRVVAVVCVHFDWVRDDRFRFAQAEALAAELRTLTTPWILVGDFNDRRGSRTLDLFEELAREARKPEDARFTFPSDRPRSEIDFIFQAPADRWEEAAARVVDEPMASDHRPVFAELRLKPAEGEAGARDD